MQRRVLAVVAVLALGGCGKSAVRARDGGALDLAVADDAGGLAPECDVLTNTGCATGERCTIGTDHGQPRDLCFAIAAAPLDEFVPCQPVVDATDATRTGDTCAAGLVCMPLDGDFDRCRRPCYMRADCAAGQGCVVPTSTSTVLNSDAGAFALRGCQIDAGCDPIAQTVCFAGSGCYLSTFDDVGRVSECLMAGSGQADTLCTNITDCAPGLRCDNGNFCRRYCYYEAAPDAGALGACPTDEGVCDQFTDSGEVYGICGSE
ncbi:MAG TPA: hypothetical protein VIA18_22515 [Polyangia bacterium]|nr:hypothetical protein [Polyangia bacterium]